MPATSIEAMEEKTNEMEIEEAENLPKLFISPTEKMMDKFTGSVKELRGLFKIPKSNNPTGSLHQQICNTAKRQFDETNGDCSLYDLDYTKDEQITNWINRTSGAYRKMQFPKTIDGMLKFNMLKKSFNFLKSLDIAAINNEIELLHPSAHEFWEVEETRAEFLEFLATWSKNTSAYFKRTFTEQNEPKPIMQANYEEEIEVGFVDGLFEMYKLRCDIEKAKTELIADGLISTYNHNFGTFIFGNHIDYRSSLIESIIEPKRLELDKSKKTEASLIAYEFLILQHASLKCILESKYDQLINVIIYDKFIAPKLLRRHSQYAIVALTRSGAALANQEILLAFMFRKINWIKRANHN